MLHLINEDVVFSKSILHEYSMKARTTRPSYAIVNPEGRPYTLFVASVLFDGNTYTSEVATNKKDAEQKAARAAIKTILATNNDCMLEIIRSKEKLITAITSSGYNKERGFVIPESQPALTNIPPPIKLHHCNHFLKLKYKMMGPNCFQYSNFPLEMQITIPSSLCRKNN